LRESSAQLCGVDTVEIETAQKVTPAHLKKNAYLYIRQSSLKQVLENTESTKRQYALRQRAIVLGWSDEQVVVIDCDQAQSAAPQAADREGFERLVTDIGMGRAGIVMGLEVSRLARSCSAWHRLLEICAITDTLVLDQDGLYDATEFNDRLLLGLKAAMSEAELHVIRQRLRGGSLSKAARGELRIRLPVGFVYDEKEQVVMDPDKQVRSAIHMFFKTFRRVGSAYLTVASFREQGLRFPKRMHCGPNKGELIWGNLTVSRAAQVLHNPRYAGAYTYGRTKTRIGIDGHVIFKELPRQEWHSLIVEAHEGYITWEEYEKNRTRLEENHQARAGHRKCPPREGVALLQGLAVCGLCGRRMSVRYREQAGTLTPVYSCRGIGNTIALPKCQSMMGKEIDEAVGRLLLEVVTPMALEVSLAVQEEVQKRFGEADKLRRQQVERARYDADLARRRYMKTDPENRLVAEELEAEWNGKLRTVREAEEEYKQRRDSDRAVMDDQKREKIMSLAKSFPALWDSPKTPQRERKRMVRLLIEDVTLVKENVVRVHVRFKGGATRSLDLPKPRQSFERWTTSREVVAEIDRLLDDHTYAEIARMLNQRGFASGQNKTFDGRRVNVIRRGYRLRDRYTRLHERGLLTLRELAARSGVPIRTLKYRREKGTLDLRCCRLSDMGDYMYEDPEAGNGKNGRLCSGRTKEVQYEA